MIDNYSEIDKLFGTPINEVPKPKIPFKPKKWHYFVGAAIAGLAIYGGYALIKKMRDNGEKIKSPVPHYPDHDFKQASIIDVPLPVAEDDQNVIQ